MPRMAQRVGDKHGTYSRQGVQAIPYAELRSSVSELRVIEPLLGWGVWKWAVKIVTAEMCQQSTCTYFVSGDARPKEFKLGG